MFATIFVTPRRMFLTMSLCLRISIIHTSTSRGRRRTFGSTGETGVHEDKQMSFTSWERPWEIHCYTFFGSITSVLTLPILFSIHYSSQDGTIRMHTRSGCTAPGAPALSRGRNSRSTRGTLPIPRFPPKTKSKSH